MLKHRFSSPETPQRVVVIGASGFIGSAISSFVSKSNIAVLNIDSKQVDLLKPDAAERLAALLKPTDSVVAVSALAPVKSTAILADNMIMVRSMIDAMKRVAPAYLLNIGSDAVFADAPLPLRETSLRAPESLHGVMHLAREIAFATEVMAPQGTLRPTLVYGAGDPHNGYGPNKFRRLANQGQEIVLFGEGEERRDHVFVDDVALLALLMLQHHSEGSLNAVTGAVYSFRDVAEMAVALSRRVVAIKNTSRVGLMPHGGFRPFDTAACRACFPNFSYTELAQGMALAQQSEYPL